MNSGPAVAELVMNCSKRFASGVTVDASLRMPIDRFSITVLFGPSGCGKTTVLRSLALLERPETGNIHCGDAVWLDAAAGVCLPPQRRGVGLLTQDLALFPHLTVARNIGYGLGKLNAAERSSRVDELLTLFQLAGLGDRYPHQISGGQQQRAALARAVASRPRLLLLDEPLSALDAPTRAQLRLELRTLLAAQAIPTVAVTHDPLEAISLADRLLVLDRGRALQDGAVQDVFARPASLDVARIVGVETVEPGRVTHVADGLATVALRSVMVTALADGMASGEVYACIRAEDVTLLRDESGVSSARNRLTARVTSMESQGPLLRVGLDCGFLLTALVTRPAAEQLALGPGETVFALIKAQAIHLVPRS